MPTFAAILAVLDAMARGKLTLHPSLEGAVSFVYAPPSQIYVQQSYPTQQIVIEASSTCCVSFGG